VSWRRDGSTRPAGPVSRCRPWSARC